MLLVELGQGHSIMRAHISEHRGEHTHESTHVRAYTYIYIYIVNLRRCLVTSSGHHLTGVSSRLFRSKGPLMPILGIAEENVE